MTKPTSGHGPTNPEIPNDGIQRFASAVELKPEFEAEYRRLHSEVWPEVVAAIHRANFRNYSIYLMELGGRKLLISYMEYVGSDLESDQKIIADDPVTRDKWWPITDSHQEVLPGTPVGQQWLPLERLMHLP
ncbi:MAG: L-rhamnose mutarotase [Bacteroidetes bacterium]|nr:L-rhamnose mutarotase [Bacteroidota bacterium]